MSERIKGFIFGALLMMVPPAFALPGEPPATTPAVAEQPQETMPYFRLTYEDAEAALSQALVERGAGGKIAATITNRQSQVIFSYNQPISVEIRGLRFDKSSQRFSANLVSISGKDVIGTRAISGRFNEMIEVPVLKRSIRAGETITSEDIELKDYAEARARVDTVTDIASLVGKTPERVITPGRPIRTHELAQPSVVKKNDMVKMVYQQGAMMISTTGQAMSDGRQGGSIAVKNLASKKIVQAVVQDASTVLIGNQEPMVTSSIAGDVYAN